MGGLAGDAAGWAGRLLAIGWLGVLGFQGLGAAAVVPFGGADYLVVKGCVYYRAYLFVGVGSHFPVLVFPFVVAEVVGVASSSAWVSTVRVPVRFENCGKSGGKLCRRQRKSSGYAPGSAFSVCLVRLRSGVQERFAILVIIVKNNKILLLLKSSQSVTSNRNGNGRVFGSSIVDTQALLPGNRSAVVVKIS